MSSRNTTNLASTALDCAKEFLFATAAASFVVADGDRCHFGDKYETGGSVPDLAGSQWNIYLTESKRKKIEKLWL